MPNRLSLEKSPYLRQHAGNPVDWYPWGEEAFEKARREDRPIFLSIGYSTCHWCHVMAHESFEDPSLAGLLNKAFVSIKVDREERPDIDSVYMKAAMLATGRGGWPLSIFMTPDGEPFFAATYIPRRSRYGMTGFDDLILRIDHLWKNEREQLSGTAGQIKKALDKEDRKGGKIETGILDRAGKMFSSGFDPEYGGFSRAPKFPSPHQIMFLLRQYHRTGEKKYLKMSELTLEKMALGGIFDHLGGGFHRYSTDRRWLVPHFEKMLYDQAMMVMAFTEGYLATGRDLFSRTAIRTIDYVMRDLRSPESLFLSAEDADSEGVEGKFYVWSMDEIIRILGDKKGREMAAIFNMSSEGNFRDEATGRPTGKNIIHLSGDTDWDRIKLPSRILFKERSKRIRPGRDGKVLTDWNALMISALARAGQAFSREDLISEAEKSMGALEKASKDENGKWFHRYMEGDRSVPAMLDDIASITAAYLDLYEGTFDTVYLEKALEGTSVMRKDFMDHENGGFFRTSHDAERLILREKEAYDGAAPSGNSMAVWSLIRASRMTGRTGLEDAASDAINSFSSDINRVPTGFAMMLSAYMHAVGPSREIVIAGSSFDETARKMVEKVRTAFIPSKVVLFRNDDSSDLLGTLAPYTGENVPIDGEATAFVCRGWNCDVPIKDVDRLESSLKTDQT